MKAENKLKEFGGIPSQFGNPDILMYGQHQVIEAMQEFAKYHVEQALKAAFESSEVRVTENALIEDGSCYTSYDDGIFTITCDKNSIINSYPNTLIK